MAFVEINLSPDRSQLRSFGWIGAAVAAAIAAWVFFRHSFFGAAMGAGTARATACVLWAAAGVLLALAAAAPWCLRPLYLLMTLIALPIGYVLSHVLMGIVFYGVFAPVGVIFRLIRRDALCRKFQRQAGSYWVRRPPGTDAKRYFRQF